MPSDGTISGRAESAQSIRAVELRAAGVGNERGRPGGARRAAHHRNVPEPQPFQYISRVAYGGVGRNVAIGADDAQYLDVVKRGEIRQSQRIVDAGVDIENHLAFAGGCGRHRPVFLLGESVISIFAFLSRIRFLRKLLFQNPLLQEFVGGEILRLRSLVNHLAMRIGVRVVFGQEVEVFLRALKSLVPRRTSRP